MLVIYCPYCFDYKNVHKTDEGKFECDDCEETFEFDIEFTKKVIGKVTKELE